MRKIFLSVVVLGVLGLFGAGCVGTLDGRYKAGMPFLKDKLVRIYERPKLQVWSAARDVLAANGTVVHEDHAQSTVTAKVDTRTILVKVEAIDQRTTQMTVQSRTRAGGRDLDLAGEMDKQIALRLATGVLATPK
jgi:hypothetical protein